MPDPRIASVRVRRVAGQATEDRDDVVVVEEPLEIRAAWTVSGELREKSISVTMRTPGDDADLATGFLFTEGLVQSAADVESVRHWSSPNVIRVALRDAVRIDTAKLERHFYTTSSCGVCGKTSIEALRVATPARPRQTKPVTSEVIHELPRRLEEHQAAFRVTGGLHAAAILDFEGALIVSREDIGRHNAVDKVIGSLFAERRMPLPDTILLVSSRASFEIVQKAWAAGFGLVAAVSGPSALAVETARTARMALVGFLRGDTANVYAPEPALASRAAG